MFQEELMLSQHCLNCGNKVGASSILGCHEYGTPAYQPYMCAAVCHESQGQTKLT